MLPDPANLRRFSGELTTVGHELSAARSSVLAAIETPGWSGPAHDRFRAEGAVVAARLHLLSGRAVEGAAAADRLAARLAAELAELRLIEHRVTTALHGLARMAVGLAGDAATVYRSALAALPASGSPEWRELARRLAAVGLL